MSVYSGLQRSCNVSQESAARMRLVDDTGLLPVPRSYSQHESLVSKIRRLFGHQAGQQKSTSIDQENKV